MELFIKWWHLVYYFYLKWYIKSYKIFTAPFYLFFRSKTGRKVYSKINKREFNSKIFWKDAENAAMPDIRVAPFVSFLFFVPLFTPIMIVMYILDSHSVPKNYFDICFILMGLIWGVFYYNTGKRLDGNKKRINKYFRQFDKMFVSTKKRFIYGIFAILTGIFFVVMPFVVMRLYVS